MKQGTNVIPCTLSLFIVKWQVTAVLNLHLPLNLYIALAQSSFLCSSLLPNSLIFPSKCVFFQPHRLGGFVFAFAFLVLLSKGLLCVFLVGVTDGGCPISPGLPADMVVSPCVTQSKPSRSRRAVV